MSIDVKEREFIWSQKYRPRKIEDCIVSTKTKTVLNDFIRTKKIPNFIFAGTSGTGKTTAALALCDEIGADVLFVNASLDSGIDTLRTKILQFASTMSFGEGQKVVILDEADGTNAVSFQPALRGFMEEFSANCSFIFTCNHPARLIDQIHSRSTLIDFKISKDEIPNIQLSFFKRVQEMLINEEIEFDKKVVASLIKKHFPDFRKIINLLQYHSASGCIDSSILTTFDEERFGTLRSSLKEKKFTEMREWVGKNLEGNGTDILRKLYDESYALLVPESIPQMILIIGEYSYRAAFVADAELNIVAALTEIMGSVQFK